MAGLAAAKRRGRQGGRPPTIAAEKVQLIVAALSNGASKASVSRTFRVPRSTLSDTLQRLGWQALVNDPPYLTTKLILLSFTAIPALILAHTQKPIQYQQQRH